MTVDQIKSTYSMRDIVERYGLKVNRAGFVRCPFHSEKTASLKIYKDSFFCFGCGMDGDIFTFVQKMEGLSFKDAYISLGGTYENGMSQNQKRHIMRERILAERRRRDKEALFERKKQRLRELGKDLNFYQMLCRIYKPFSDEWCVAVENREVSFFEWEVLWEEVNGGVR